ncbi:MAG: PepSY-associated TM helix domain-containing protein [Holophagaceae bacterium]|nr:PepSY-associated TM helix domain-containing protein [Holophagaceae bacterium]
MNPRFLRWLRQAHAWVGLAGATFGLLFGITGLLLNHRSVMKVEAGHLDEKRVQVEVAPSPATAEVLARDLAARFGFPLERAQWRVDTARSVRFSGAPVITAEQWTVKLNGHARFARATYTPGNRTVELEQREANVLAALQRLHKADGSQAGWILLTDAFAGGLIFLTLTGIVLWTRLSGPKLLAAGLVTGGLVTAILVASRAW